MKKDALELDKYYAYNILKYSDAVEVILKSNHFFCSNKRISFYTDTQRNTENLKQFVDKLNRHFYPEDHYQEHDAKVIEEHWESIKNALITQSQETGKPFSTRNVNGVPINYGLDYLFSEQISSLEDKLIIAQSETDELKKKVIEAETELRLLNQLNSSK